MKDDNKKENMKDRRIWLTIEKTIQVEPYEPVKVVIGMSGDVPNGEKSARYFDDMEIDLANHLEKYLENLIND